VIVNGIGILPASGKSVVISAIDWNDGKRRRRAEGRRHGDEAR